MTIAINPTHPAHLVAVATGRGGPGEPRSTNSVYVSSDGGESWKTLPAANPDRRVQGDDTIVFSAYGSKDPADMSHIVFSRSRDGGQTFSVPIRVSDTPGDAQDSDDTVEGAVPAIGPRGEVYLAWAGPRGIVFDRSLDGGYSFGEDRVIASNPGGWDLPVPGVPRHNGLPVTSADLSDGPDRGSVYVTWIDERNGDPDVFLIASRDGGATWSEPLRVNDDPKGNGKAQLFAWTAVDPTDGAVNVVFYDRRGLEGTLTGLTLARSVDGGRTFVNHRVAQKPFTCRDEVFLGDYIGLAARDGRVVAAYAVALDERSEGETALYAALFRFKPGTQEAAPARPGS